MSGPPATLPAGEHLQNAANAVMWNSANPKVRSLRLSADFTRALRNRARQKGATVHGALCAALVIAGRQVSVDWREIPLRLGSPVNTRKVLGVGEGCGVFFIGAKNAFDTEVKGFWNIVRHATADVHAAGTRESVMASLSGIQQLIGGGIDVAGAAQFASTAFVRDAMVSNLGALSIESHFGKSRLEALWGPAVLLGFEGEQTIGAATLNGSLSLTHTSHTPHEGLLEAMEAVLIQQACVDRWSKRIVNR